MLDYKNYMPNVDEGVENQVRDLDASGIFDGQKLRLMPDAHPGMGCTIGTTLTFDNKIVPGIVGVDIACRVSLFKLPVFADQLDLAKLDTVVNENIPSGFSVRAIEHPLSLSFPYEDLRCWDALDNHNRIRLSLGSLGGGNHYIEVDQDASGETCLNIHCGSRGLGKKVCDYYTDLALQETENRKQEIRDKADVAIRDLKEAGHTEQIQSVIERRNDALSKMNNVAMDYISGQNLEDYLHDMLLCNEWSYRNHQAIAENIFMKMDWSVPVEHITCIHNYVDVKHKMIRKGAIAGYAGDIGIIPLNMRDGVLIVEALGNEDWNNSLPHGAGRLYGRAAAKREITLEEFKKSMKGVYSSCVVENTIDESPMAYKDAHDIMEAIRGNAIIKKHLLPLYNFKAKE